MTANDPTPPEGENVSPGSFDHQTVAQSLLRERLERIAYDVREQFHRAARKTEQGDLDESDLLALEVEIEQAQIVLAMLREAIEE